MDDETGWATSSELWGILAVVVLTIGTGVFVASGFALVNLDRRDPEQRQARGETSSSPHREQTTSFVELHIRPGGVYKQGHRSGSFITTPQFNLDLRLSPPTAAPGETAQPERRRTQPLPAPRGPRPSVHSSAGPASHRFEDPELPVSEKEKQIALDDIACKADTDLVRRLSEGNDAAEQQVVEGRLLDLQESRQHLDEVVRLANDVVEEG